MAWRFFLLCLLFACSNRKTPLYAVKLDKFSGKDSLLNIVKGYSFVRNQYRAANHVPLLPDSFVLVGYGMDWAGWQNEDIRKRPVYSNKTITWTVDSLYSERDFFIGPGNEILIIWYGMDMGDEMIPIRPGYHFACTFKQKFDDTGVASTSDSTVDAGSVKEIPLEFNSQSHRLTIDQADSVLKSWKISVH